MSHLSNIFTKQAVLTPKRNGFDLSHESIMTAKVGTLTPCFVEEVLGNTNLDLHVNGQISLPPLATDFFGRVDAVMEAFWCPYRVLYGGWQQFYSQNVSKPTNATDYPPPAGTDRGMTITNDMGSPMDLRSGKIKTFGRALPSAQPEVNEYLPCLYDKFLTLKQKGYIGAGSLADYLGAKLDMVADPSSTTNQYALNMMPFLAYHKIWEDFYRRPLLEAPAFVMPASNGASLEEKPSRCMYWPYIRMASGASDSWAIGVDNPDNRANDILNDGTSVFKLRQRHWDYDTFTSATPTAQGISGSDSEITLETGAISKLGDSGQFSIGQLRAANSLALFLDRQQASGWRYKDNCLARTGCLPPNLADTPLYLGRVTAPVYNNSIKTTVGSANTSQPWKGAGQRVASPATMLDGHIINNFHATEMGLFMCIFSLVPHAFYGTGSRRYLHHRKLTDFPDALLQNAGVQAVNGWELCTISNSAEGRNVFGYNVPGYENLYHDDEVHGLFQDGQSLENFAIKRSFQGHDAQGNPSNYFVNSAFCTIPTSALDEVCATDAKVSNFGCQCDFYFTEKVVTPLSGFVVPTLGTPDSMRRQFVKKGGSDLC